MVVRDGTSGRRRDVSTPPALPRLSPLRRARHLWRRARAACRAGRGRRPASPAIVEGAPFGDRHRARLPKIGIFQEGSHRVVDTPHCLVHHPLVNEVATATKAALRRTGVSPYADRPHRGMLRYLQVVVERRSASPQVVLVANDESPDALEPVAREIERALGARLHSLWWNGNPARTHTILRPAWHRWAGARPSGGGWGESRCSSRLAPSGNRISSTSRRSCHRWRAGSPTARACWSSTPAAALSGSASCLASSASSSTRSRRPRWRDSPWVSPRAPRRSAQGPSCSRGPPPITGPPCATPTW